MADDRSYDANPYRAPVDLSHLEPHHADTARRWAFLGRVSTRDLQDPASSIPGQLSRAQTALPPGSELVAWYWDIESGALDLDQRGHGDYASLDIDGVPRTGGVTDCLEAARRGEIDAVVVDEVSRPARDMLASLTLEQQLDRAGVAYRVAAEPAGMEHGARSAQYVLRRTSQMAAGWYRLFMMEMSERGQREHARRGFLHGTAPYGYIAVYAAPAPRVPTGRLFEPRQPRVLQLDPDERKPATVRAIFRWRTEAEWGYGTIARELNANRDRHPTPTATSRWHAQTVRGMLRNPKHTGYMVWNRKGSRTNNHRGNSMSQWVWSPEPTHEAIVPLDTWVRAQEIAAAKRM